MDFIQGGALTDNALPFILGMLIGIILMIVVYYLFPLQEKEDDVLEGEWLYPTPNNTERGVYIYIVKTKIKNHYLGVGVSTTDLDNHKSRGVINNKNRVTIIDIVKDLQLNDNYIFKFDQNSTFILSEDKKTLRNADNPKLFLSKVIGYM